MDQNWYKPKNMFGNRHWQGNFSYTDSPQVKISQKALGGYFF